MLWVACTPTLPFGFDGGWSRGYAQLGVPFRGLRRGCVLSIGCFSLVGAWVLCLRVWLEVPSQRQWWLLVCGAGGDAGCGAGLSGAPGAPFWRVGALSWCRCTWVCAVLGGCLRGDAGCCVLCFLFCAFVPLLIVCMLCSSYLCSGFFSPTPDTYSSLCLVLHCTAPLDVSKSLTRMAKQHHHDSLSQRLSLIHI